MPEAGKLSGAGELLGEATKSLRKRRGEVTPESANEAIPKLSWEEFKRYFGRQWKQGEHVTLLGTTGSGKTTLSLELLPIRTYVVAFGTKAKDSTFDGLLRQGYYRVNEWPPPATKNRIVLWPVIRNAKDARDVKQKQREIFYESLASIYKEGGWCVYVDEIRYIADYLRLDEELELLWQQGRSIGITVMGGTQRPRFIPLVAYDQATHLFFWRENDDENIKRLGSIGGTNRAEVEAIVRTLPEKEFLYINTRTGDKCRSKVDLRR